MTRPVLRRALRRPEGLIARTRWLFCGSALVSLALTLPALAWRIASTLSLPQRVSWLAWTAIVTAVVVARRRRADPVRV